MSASQRVVLSLLVLLLLATVAHSRESILSLDLKDNGQHFNVSVGQQIDISLGARNTCAPFVSSSSLQLENVALDWPPTPGLSTRTYIFHAASPGDAQVHIPISDCFNPDSTGFVFSASFHVKSTAHWSSTPLAATTRDQANTTPWAGGWTIVLANDLRQSFMPSLPRLTAIELDLIVGNPGAASDDVNLTLRSPNGDILSVLTKTVSPDGCNHALFVFPKGGWPVSPGELYSIEVNGGNGLLGWKYVIGGYPRGAASVKDRSLVIGARSTFLFRTFGTT